MVMNDISDPQIWFGFYIVVISWISFYFDQEEDTSLQFWVDRLWDPEVLEDYACTIVVHGICFVFEIS